jgi:hypothetical protein
MMIYKKSMILLWSWEMRLGGENREMKLGGSWEMMNVFSFAPKTPTKFPKP